VWLGLARLVNTRQNAYGHAARLITTTTTTTLVHFVTTVIVVIVMAMIMMMMVIVVVVVVVLSGVLFEKVVDTILEKVAQLSARQLGRGIALFGRVDLLLSDARVTLKLGEYLLHVQGAYLMPLAATIFACDKRLGLFVIVFHLREQRLLHLDQRLGRIVTYGHRVMFDTIETLLTIRVLVTIDIGPRLISVIVQVVDAIAHYRTTHLIAIAEEDLWRECELLTATVAHFAHHIVNVVGECLCE
jgi:hypothetical protein